jgi:hypothetical protein
MATRVSYTDTTTNERAIGDTIYNIDFQEAALLQLLGFSSKNLSKFNVKSGWPSTKLEWLEDVNVPFTTLLAESGFDASEEDMTVTTGTGQYFRKGDIIGVYPTGTTTGVFQEKVLVTSVSGDVLAIVRGYGDTSGTAALTGTGLRLITRANEENSIYTTEHMTTPTAPYNHTQILDAAVEMSETEALMSRYGIDDHMDMQIGKLFDNGGSEGRLAQLLHQTFYFGERVVRASTAGAYGSMGGFNLFVTAATASADHVFTKSTAAITRADIHKVIRAVRSANGKVTHLITGAWGIEKIRDMYSGTIRTTQEQRVMGSPEVEEIVTPHGSVRVIFDWMCPESEYYFINADKCGWIPFREFSRKTVYGGVENNPYDGRIEKVIGEYTFALANPKSFGRIYGASTTE